MNAKHSPVNSRCTNCRWVHEADSTRGTSFMGVELCRIHAAAPALLAALQGLMTAEDGDFEPWNMARAAILSAEVPR